MQNSSHPTFGSEGMDAGKGLIFTALAGISGYWLISNVKMRNKPLQQPGGEKFREDSVLKNAEIIGDYLAHGYGGTAFRLPDGNVLKIVSLEKSLPPPYNQLNTNQADFFEALHNGDLSFTEDIVNVKHFGKGRAWVKMANLVNSESPGPSTDLSVGEKIAYWVMEYVPTIGRGEMSDARVNGGQNRLKAWGQKNGWEIEDFKESNFGERTDGSFVMFDPWVKPL